MKLPYMIKVGDIESRLVVEFCSDGVIIGYKEKGGWFRVVIGCLNIEEVNRAEEFLLDYVKKLPKDSLYYQNKGEKKK